MINVVFHLLPHTHTRTRTHTHTEDGEDEAANNLHFPGTLFCAEGQRKSINTASETGDECQTGRRGAAGWRPAAFGEPHAHKAVINNTN